MKVFLKGLLKAYLISVCLILVLAVCISVTTLKENMIRPCVIVISAFSICIGAFFVACDKKEKGLINGAVIGVIYMTILYLISSILSWDFSISINSLIMIFAGIISGIIGGVVGVNFKK